MLAVTGADPLEIERRKLDLALQLTEKYRALMSHWLWGDSVLEWIRQCEITFESKRRFARCFTRTCGRTPAGRVSSPC